MPLDIKKNSHPNQESLLNKEACAFLEALHQSFYADYSQTLTYRKHLYNTIDKKLNAKEAPLESLHESLFLGPNQSSDWTGPPMHPKLAKRHVEITGPASEARMVFNAFQCEANAYMSDFEDSLSPTFHNILAGQHNLKDALEGQLKKDGNAMKAHQTQLFVRPRGLHLAESNISLNSTPLVGAFVDFGLFLFHNAHTLYKQEAAPFFYLPKLETAKEAQLWAELFRFSETYLDLPKQSIRATVLIETITAAFQTEAILYELKDYSAGLNCGRWDYIFSFIKRFRHSKEYILPDRNLVNMDVDFMKHYSLNVIQECHKRGVHAMGGMSAFVPFRMPSNATKEEKQEIEEKNNAILEAITKDKTTEAKHGHDGAWAAHPELVPIIKEVFKTHLKGKPNQIEKSQNHTPIKDHDLLKIPAHLKEAKNITELGLRINISVCLQYVIAWLNGVGAVGIAYNLPGSTGAARLMEDLATAEISRTQINQWWHHQVTITMQDGSTKKIKTIFESLFDEEVARIKSNSQLVKYDSTPEIDALEKDYEQNPSAELKASITSKKAHCIQHFEQGVVACKQLFQEKNLTAFIPDLIYPFLSS